VKCYFTTGAKQTSHTICLLSADHLLGHFIEFSFTRTPAPTPTVLVTIIRTATLERSPTYNTGAGTAKKMLSPDENLVGVKIA
jgi:hypothetical protein